MEQSHLPRITFGIPTLNEEKRLEVCLKSIFCQKYPKSKIEIIVIDGGSSDKTIEIAKKNNIKILINYRKLPEPGLALAYQVAKGNYMVFMATDNILYDENWIIKMVQPFIDKPDIVYSTFSQVENKPSDNIWNKYINEDSDPFSLFTFGNASHPNKYSKLYPTEFDSPKYVIYKFSPKNFPLIALAQCTILKTGLSRSKVSQNDDILPLVELINTNKKIAFIKNTGIYHLSIGSFQDLIQKFNKRIYNSISTNSFISREKHTTIFRKIKKYLFIFYSFSIILPIIHSIILLIKNKKISYIVHFIVCFVISFLIIYNFIKIYICKKLN